MKKIFVISLLILSANKTIAQPPHLDSLLAHYPLQVGNVWDYYGGVHYFYGQVFYPRLIFITAIGDSLHANGKRYTILERIIYDMWGQPKVGALGTVYRQIYLQRIDSLSLNVYQATPDYNLRYGDELLIDSLKAMVGDSIFTNRLSDHILRLFKKSVTTIFGRQRTIRELIVVYVLVGFQFKTAEGLGELLWESGGEGEPSFRELRAAVIRGDTLGVLLRQRPAKLELSVSRLDFTPELKMQAIQFRNYGAGLAIIDSVKMQNEKWFYSQASYKGGYYGNMIFSKGPFLVFPQDSITLNLFLSDTALSHAFKDTLRIFAHGINEESLPEIKLPVAFSPKVGIETGNPSLRPPQQLHLTVHPNPSRQRFEISYNLFRRERINIRVIDLLGRQVALLANQEMPAENHKFIWEPVNLTAGVYFIVLETAKERRLQKIYVIR